MDDTREQTKAVIDRWDARRATLAKEVEETAQLGRGLTPEERDRDLVRLCRDAWSILEGRPDRRALIAFVEPRAPDFRDKWRLMVARYRSESKQLPR
jgi:hypothetical protein